MKLSLLMGKLLLSVATLMGVMGVVVLYPSPMVGQTNPDSSPQQESSEADLELAEAEQLNQQVEQLYSQGQYADAIPLAERALAIREKVLGAEHPSVATSLNNLAVLYRAIGNYQEAEPLHQSALAIREKVLGAEHPHVATSLNNLAELYWVMGNYQQAEPLHQRSLAIREKVLGAEHPLVASSLYNLAGLYWARGDSTQAIEWLARGTNIQENNLAPILATGSEAQKRDYMATLSHTTHGTISLHLQDAPNNSEAAHLALTTLLRRKGRILDAVTNSLQTLRQNLTPEDQELLDKLAATRSQLAALIFKGAETPHQKSTANKSPHSKPKPTNWKTPSLVAAPNSVPNPNPSLLKPCSS